MAASLQTDCWSSLDERGMICLHYKPQVYFQSLPGFGNNFVRVAVFSNTGVCHMNYPFGEHIRMDWTFVETESWVRFYHADGSGSAFRII